MGSTYLLLQQEYCNASPYSNMVFEVYCFNYIRCATTSVCNTALEKVWSCIGVG